jgi:type I site-specific restriction endonuclease
MLTKEEAKRTVADLVERFAEQSDAYHKADYNETQTRRDFIDPFFKALGWDVDNSAGNAEAYREVIHEDKLRIKSVDKEAVKAPDYAFRLPGGKRLFFVEAKKPSVLVKEDVASRLAGEALRLEREAGGESDDGLLSPTWMRC